MPNQAERDWLAQIEEFANSEIAPAAGSWTQSTPPGKSLLCQAASLGLTRVETPVKDGGLEFTFDLKAKACEILAAADFGFAMSVVNSHNVAAKLALCAGQQVKDRWLPLLFSGEHSACTALTESNAGSDFASIRMTATRKSGGWVLNGEKTWITNARHASLAIVYAQCGDHGDRRGIAAFVVDLNGAGAERFPLDSAFSQVSTGTGGFRLTDYWLSDENLLLEPGTAFKSILSEINGARTYVAAMCCGMVQAALDAASIYGEERHSFGKPLSGHQAWRLDIARCASALAASKSLVALAVKEIVDGHDAQLLSAQAKIHAVANAQHHLGKLLHAMGAEGLNPSRPFARHLAAAQIAALVDGSTEMLLERVAHLTRSRVRHVSNST